VRESKGLDAFQTQYGKNGNKKNAYGEDAQQQSAATAACKKEQSDNATKFAEDYKNFGQCVKANQNQSE